MCARALMSVWSHPGMLWLARLFGGDVSGRTLCERRMIDGIGHRNAGGGCAARSVGRPRFYHGRGWPQGPRVWFSVLGFWFLSATLGWCFCFCAGIRDLLACFKRCPCAGRHLLFFAAAKKSRQKKAANTASPCSYPRAPNVPTPHTAAPWLVLVANASNRRLTHFRHPNTSQRRRMIAAAQVANCV